MALQKQIVPISFAQGVDTKTDPKQVVQGKLLRCENGVFRTAQEIRKRDGYTALPKNILGTVSSITAAIGLESYKNELDICDGKYLYGYNSATGSMGWIQKDIYQSAKIEVTPVVANNYSKRSPTGAYNASGMKSYYYNDSQTDFPANTIIDNGTGDVLENNIDAFNPTNIGFPRVVSFGDYFVNLGTNNGMVGIAYSANNFFSTQTNLTGMPVGVGIAYAYDAVTVGSNLIIIYAKHNSTEVKAFYVNSSFAASVPVVIASSTTAESCTVWGDATNRVWFSWDDGTNVKYAIYNSDLTSVILSPTVVGAAGAKCQALTGTSTTTNNSMIVEEVGFASSYNHFIKIWSVNSTGTVTSLQSVYSLQLSGKAFYYNSVTYFLAKYVSTLQSTYFLYGIFNNLTPKVLGKFYQGLGGASNSTSGIPTPDYMNTSPGIYEYVFEAKGNILTQDGGVFSQYVLKNAKITLSPPLDSQDLANDLHLTGGQLWMYDSLNVVEHGFHLFPENLTSTPGTTGAMTAGSYEFVVIYEWTDAQGQIHQSAPSPPLTVVFGSGTNNSTTITCSSLRVTNKANISNVLYRTTVNGSVFYRETSVIDLTISTPTSGTNTVSLTANLADSVLIGNQQLYTNGGEVENIAVPNVLAITNYRNRLIVIPSENPLTWWYSKQVIPGSPVSFSDLFVQNVDQRGGNLTALSVMDDKLVLFKNSQIFYVVGDGPAPNGSGNDYTEAQFISVDTGCSVKESVVLMPLGLMFQSPKGFYLLDRGLNVQYIGAEVEFYNDQTTTSAVLIANTTQVRFTLGNGVSLVYDYLFKQWDIFTNISAVASTIYQGQFTYVNSAGLVLKETPGTFTDNGTAIAMLLETGWLSFAGLQGFQRIYEVILLGEYKSTHTLLVEVYYDFEDTVSQTTTITPTATAPYQWSIMLKRQKCEAIRFQITEADTGTPAEGLSISSITVEVGIKGGLNRLSAARSFE